jgi:hypothetical protein
MDGMVITWMILGGMVGLLWVMALSVIHENRK